MVVGGAAIPAIAELAKNSDKVPPELMIISIITGVLIGFGIIGYIEFRARRSEKKYRNEMS